MLQGDGGWEPKCREDAPAKRGRGRKRRANPGTEASGSVSSDEETDADVNASVAGMPSTRCPSPTPTIVRKWWEVVWEYFFSQRLTGIYDQVEAEFTKMQIGLEKQAFGRQHRLE